LARYVIVGNSVGAVGAVEAIREVDREGSLTIISDEPYHVYSRPRISEYLAGESSLEDMLYRPREFYESNGIQTFLGRKAVALDLDQSLLRLEDGESIPWDRLLLATGGVPFVPRMEGLEKDGIFTFTTLGDAQRLAEALDDIRRMVVIGGGLIGISVTEALVKRGVQVTVVELKDWVLNTILDEQAARLAQGVLERAGVRVLTGHTVQRILGRPRDQGRVGGVVLENGEEVPCDGVVVAIGVVPRTEIVANTSVTVNRGIVVDRHMATNIPHVYACGDVAEAFDFVYGVNRVIPIWPNAYLGGRIAGYNMAGLKMEYPGAVAMNSLKYFGLPIVSAGLYEAPGDGYQVLTSGDRDRVVYKKLVLKDGALVGLVFVGEIEKAGILLGLMREKLDVEGFKEHLLAPDFGFVYLPAALRQQRLARNGKPPQFTAMLAKKGAGGSG
jgi:NAD(P)H-nitrite reductase large subunit